ncbi:MAG: hypothetical protein V1715_04430 [bacterium]
MASSSRTIVYINGDDPRVGGADYKGNFPDKPLSFWRKFGAEHNQNWMYKGYRYHDNGTDSVIVFTKVPLTKEDLKNRKRNGFLGIKEYYIG